MGNSPQPQTRRLVLLVWILVGVFYVYLSYDYIQASIRDRRLGEYIDHVVQLAGDERRPPKEVRALILVKAEELGVPLRGEQIEIAGSGQQLNVTVNYQANIEIPVVERVIYRKDFNHNVKYHQQR